MFRDVHTEESQAQLTPEIVLDSLKAGNHRFVTNTFIPRDFTAQIKKTAIGQYPEAVILSCIDSRVPVEHIFDKGFGDIFVARVAGNFVNEDILGSIEFSTAIAGAKIVLVLGHSECGAIKAAIDDVQMGNLTGMLAKIKPAVAMSNNFEGDKNSANSDYVDAVITNNVLHTIQKLRQQSPITTELEEQRKIKIVGAVYNIETGVVTFLD